MDKSRNPDSNSEKANVNRQNPRRNSKNQRRNLMRKFKPANDSYKIRSRLNKQINRLKKLALNQKELHKKLLESNSLVFTNELQEKIQKNSHHVKLTSSEILQLQQKVEEPGLPYFHTPIESPKQVKLPVIPELSQIQKDSIQTVIRSPDWEFYGLHRDDLAILQEYNPQKGSITDYWLNDNIVNSYLKLLLEESPDIFAIDSQIASNILLRKMNSGVPPYKLLRKHKLLGYKILLFPVNSGDHWFLVAWNGVHKTLTCFDSLHNPREATLAPFQSYLIERRIFEGLPRETLAGLQLVTTPIPYSLKQKNAVDCGVYMLMYARAIIQGFPFTFNQLQMNSLRQVIFFEFMEEKLLPFF